MRRWLIGLAALVPVSCASPGDSGEGAGTSTSTGTSEESSGSGSTSAESGGTETGTGTGTDTEGGSCPEGELGDDDNCGACGVACTVHDLYAFGEYGGCEGGACKPTWSPCFEESDAYADCAVACAAFGETCVAQGCGDGAFTATAYVSLEACESFENPQDAWYGNIACDEAPTLGGGGGRCCCSDTP